MKSSKFRVPSSNLAGLAFLVALLLTSACAVRPAVPLSPQDPADPAAPEPAYAPAPSLTGEEAWETAGSAIVREAAPSGHEGHLGAHPAPQPNPPAHEHPKPKPGDHARHGETPDPPAPPERAYVCPMHPQSVSDEPGQCPICGMELVQRKSQPKPESQR